MAAQSSTIRRVAAHKVMVHGAVLPMHVVEICNGKAVRWFPLTEEIAMTAWLPGTVEIKETEGEEGLSAFWNGRQLG